MLSMIGLQSQAQSDDYKQPSQQSEAYHEYRLKMSVPPYGLARVKVLIDKISDNDGVLALDKSAYNSLAFREQFTYHMIHGEADAQNCDVMPQVQEGQLKIFGQLPDIFNDHGWSQRQDRFFISHRDSVLSLIRESIGRSHHIGANYKRVIVGLNAREMIPFIIDQYKADKKDHDLLTVLMLLMKKNKYQPFLGSVMGRKLYGDESNYQTYISFNTANEELIIKRTMDFYYKSLQRQSDSHISR